VENSRITQVGQVVGTPLWMAPEQVLGRDVDERADLYSLATVLYTLLARRFPFDGAAMGEVVMQRLSSEARPIGEYTFLGEPIPKTLQQLLHVCLAREPERRLSSAKAMVDVLRAALRSLSQDEPVGVPVGAWGSFSTRRSS
jgi:serine/threonine-protein kinase